MDKNIGWHCLMEAPEACIVFESLIGLSDQRDSPLFPVAIIVRYGCYPHEQRWPTKISSLSLGLVFISSYPLGPLVL